MAGKIASFVSGGLLVIRIGKVQFAYCQSVSFNQNATVIPVGGLGSMGFSALEPTYITASGSIRIVRWDSRLMGAIRTQANGSNTVFPHNLKVDADTTLANTFGNSLLDTKAFNPIGLLLSATFDIDVYERGTNAIFEKDGTVKSISDALTGLDFLFKFVDCRFTDYSFDFAPGQLLFENLNYVCSQIQETF